MTNVPSGSLSAAERRFRDNRQEYQDYLPLTEGAQADLREDVELLQSQEGWDVTTQLGIAAWVDDRDNIFRCLKRNGFDADKTHSALLAAVCNRVARSLHLPVPSISPYMETPLFYMLPASRFTDRMGRPVAVLTVREVVRDENGKIADLERYTWWCLELLRRMLRDYWVKGKWSEGGRGQGGEGCAVVIDAGGAGYRNIDFELLPVLGAVGPKNFPGLVDVAYVVNAGWTQRNLWRVVQRVTPKSAKEKIRFLDSAQDAEEFFDLDRLPKVYGGRDPFVFDPLDNPVLQYYQRTAASSETVTAPTRAPSFASAADVFYTAHNTPLNSPESSRRPSTYATMGLGEGLLKMTASSAPEDDTYQSASLTDQSPSEEGPMTSASSSRQTSKASSSSQWSSLTAMQRIKSLTNFHLYLSPSRLAQVDLLSDSSGDEPTPRPIAFPPRRSVRPAFLEPHAASVADRRSRPPLRVHGIPSHLASDQQVRSYSDQLQQHHAKRLEGLDGRAMVPDNPVRAPEATEQNLDPELESQSSSATTSPEESRPISAFSRSSNPWFGYPALIVSDTSHPGTIHIRPRYPRNRKRDLVKTLLFLFMIRLQSWRDTFERMLGLYRLPSWGLRTVARTPSEGLILSAGKSISRKRGPLAVTRSRDTEKGWIWMVIGFLLLRGTWTRVIAGPLEALGLESVRDLLGLV